MSKIKELMKENPVIIPPDCTLMEAARIMKSIDCGSLLVGTPEKLEGIITDRDIVVRAVAKDRSIATEKVRDYMTKDVCVCSENDTADQAADMMRDKNVSRIVVTDEDGKPCGILTFGRIIRKDESMQEIATVIECAVGRKAA